MGGNEPNVCDQREIGPSDGRKSTERWPDKLTRAEGLRKKRAERRTRQKRPTSVLRWNPY